MRPFPVMRPAWDETKEKVLELFKAELWILTSAFGEAPAQASREAGRKDEVIRSLIPTPPGNYSFLWRYK